jgi:hypothetical protein
MSERKLCLQAQVPLNKALDPSFPHPHLAEAALADHLPKLKVLVAVAAAMRGCVGGREVSEGGEEEKGVRV